MHHKEVGRVTALITGQSGDQNCDCEHQVRHSEICRRPSSGGESRKNNWLLDTPSTSLRVASPWTLLRTVSLSNGLSNHGSRPS